MKRHENSQVDLKADSDLANLMAAYYAGDDSALSILYCNSKSLLEKRAKFLLASANTGLKRVVDEGDLVQELFLSVVKTRHRGTGRYQADRAPVATWFNRILTNVRSSLLRLRRYQPAPQLDKPSELEAPATNHEVRMRVQELPAVLREVVELRYWGGCTCREIGDRLKMSPASISRHHNAALEKLRS